MTKNRGVKADRAQKKMDDPTLAAKSIASAERLAALPKVPGVAGKHSRKRQEFAELKVTQEDLERQGDDAYMIINPEQGVHLSQLCLKSFRKKFQEDPHNYHVKRVPIPDSMKKVYNNRNRAQQFFTVVGRSVKGLMDGLTKCKTAVKIHNEGGTPTGEGDDAAPVPIAAYNDGDIQHLNHHEVGVHEGAAPAHEADEGGDIVPQFVVKAPGTKKRKWSEQEEQALIDGMKEHSGSKEPWKAILNDPNCAILLEQNWTNVNLFDKYRLLIKSGKVGPRPPSERAERSDRVAAAALGEGEEAPKKKSRKPKVKRDDEDGGDVPDVEDDNDDDDEGFTTSNKKTKGLKRAAPMLDPEPVAEI